MASLIRSNSNFAEGNLVLLGHTLNVREDSLVTLSMSLACLGTADVMARNLANFGRDAIPPVALPSDAAKTPLVNGSVYLSEYQNRVENGICYIDASYAGIYGTGNTSGSRYEYSESHTVKTFNGLLYLDQTLAGTGAIVTSVWNYSFDYVSPSTVVTHTSFDPNFRKNIKLPITSPKSNVRGGPPVSTSGNVYRASSKGEIFQNWIATVQVRKIGRVYSISETITTEFDQKVE